MPKHTATLECPPHPVGAGGVVQSTTGGGVINKIPRQWRGKIISMAGNNRPLIVDNN